MSYLNTNSLPENPALDSRVIEWLRFPLTCLIVLWHVQIPGMSNGGFAYLLRVILSNGICRIAIPLFFMISGYLFFQNLEQWNKKVWLGKLNRRFHTLLIPYLCWNVLGIAFICVSQRLGASTANPGSIWDVFQDRGWLRLFWDCNRITEQWTPPDVNILGVVMHKGMPANSPLWYIRDLMVMNLLAPFIYAFVKQTRLFGIALSGTLYLLNIWLPLEGFSIIGFFFYSIGAYCAIRAKGLGASFQKVERLSYIGAVVFLLLFVISFSLHWPSQYFQRLFQLFGTVAAYNLAVRILRGKKVIPVNLADSSFFVYASHSLLLSGIVFLLGKTIPGTNQLLFVIQYLLAAAITITLCVGIFRILERLCPRLLSFICGNRNNYSHSPTNTYEM